MPLPNISRAGVVIDGNAADVEIVGASESLTAVVNGLTVTGANFTLRSMHIHGFTGACVAVSGEGGTIGGPSAGQGNTFGGCTSGLAVSGADATVQGNLIGYTRDAGPDPVESGVIIAAGDALVGGGPLTPGAANRIGFAQVGVFVGAGAGPAFTGVRIERNNIGSKPTGEPAAVGTGIVLAQPSDASLILANAIENATSGIVVGGQDDDSSTRNRISGNTFDAITGMAIDLGDDGARNANDAGDADLGPNTLLNHPVITRATQTRLTGEACAGCTVEIYRAAHSPGGESDYGRVPLSAGAITSDGSGHFALDNPAAAPGEWLVALAIDADGNTSEFGPPARVGAGAVLCGNVQLHPGWNHLAYFGSEPVALLGTFPPDPSGSVTAIYKFVDGTDEWQSWFNSTAAGRSLASVEPGESYWFFASQPVTLAGGFSISFPVPVDLATGGNDFVYLGATAHPADALASLGVEWTALYRYDAENGRWLRFGDPSVPAWAQDFSTLDACSTYFIRLTAPATLIPLQP
jgi:hypothetical protein